jgi:uncharacterized tellurite resistance protein B-like protein
MDLDQKKLFCRVVGQLIVADAQVTDAEHDFLESLMNRFELSEADKESIVDGISTANAAEDAISALDDAAKDQLIEELVAAATVDGVLAGPEAKMIQSVKDALGRG